MMVLKNAERVLIIQERRARYLGLDALAQRQVEIEYFDTEIIDAEVLRRTQLFDRGNYEASIEVEGTPNGDV